VLFVWDASTGAELAQYTISAAAAKTMNDITIVNVNTSAACPTAPCQAVFISNTTAPFGPGTEVQFELPLGPGGALPPGDVPPPANTGATAANPGPVNPAAIPRPT